MAIYSLYEQDYPDLIELLIAHKDEQAQLADMQQRELEALQERLAQKDEWEDEDET